MAINHIVISLVAVCNNNNEVLLLKRTEHVHCANMWSFPGGKVKSDEMPLEAAIRELKEETNISGQLWQHIGRHTHCYPDRTLNFSFFFCRDYGKDKLQTESAFQWIKLEKLQTLHMPEANQALIKMLSRCHQQGLFPRF